MGGSQGRRGAMMPWLFLNEVRKFVEITALKKLNSSEKKDCRELSGVQVFVGIVKGEGRLKTSMTTGLLSQGMSAL